MRYSSTSSLSTQCFSFYQLKNLDQFCCFRVVAGLRSKTVQVIRKLKCCSRLNKRAIVDNYYFSIHHLSMFALLVKIHLAFLLSPWTMPSLVRLGG